MKKHFVVNFIVVFAVMFTGCTKEMRNNLNELSSPNTSQTVDEAKEKFLSETTKELKRVEMVINEIENEVKKTSTELNQKSRDSLEQLKKKRLTLERQIGVLKNVSNENWKMSKESFSESMNEFKNEFNSFIDELNVG